MHRLARTTFATAALALTATLAHADVVQLNSYTFSLPNSPTSATSLSVTSPSYTGGAGEFSGTLNGKSFTTFCTDLLQNFYFGTSYSNYSVVSGVSAWGSAKSQELDHVMSYLMGAGAPHDANSSALAQALVWEVIYENSANYDLSSGTFKSSSTNSAMQSALSSLSWATIDATPISYHVDKLYSATNQDFMVVTQALPEPSSIALVAAALLGLVAAGRRRASRD
jgi:hypothetical protein